MSISLSGELPVVIAGAGPAGLTAAYELTKAGKRPVVLEKSGLVGGISRTETYKGYRFDIGGHRFFTKVTEVEDLWHEVLGDDMISVNRLSRIFYGGKYYMYPLSLFNALWNLGPVESYRILLSYTRARLKRPFPNEQNLEQWVINRFGERLYLTFFKTYTEKVWGIPCDQIEADWAAQRIRNLSVKRAILHAIKIKSDATTLIDKFLYPRLGPGMMWERFRDKTIEGGGSVQLNSEVTRINLDGKRFRSITVREGDTEKEVFGSHFINSMPITHLIRRLSPAPSKEILAAAKDLSYRDFVVVALIVDREDMFPDNWIYIHSPEVKVGRIQNFRNWSAEMIPDGGKTCIGMEYFCTQGDGLWAQSNEELIELATQELQQIGLAMAGEVIDGTVLRQPNAYPVYDSTYQKRLGVVRNYLDSLENIYSVGRAGMHRYNNQDHSMLTAMLAVRNILGENNDLWTVNVERSYSESFLVDSKEDRAEGVLPIHKKHGKASQNGNTHSASNGIDKSSEIESGPSLARKSSNSSLH